MTRRQWRHLSLIGACAGAGSCFLPFFGFRHYVFAQAIQFALAGLVVPALASLGAPLELLARTCSSAGLWEKLRQRRSRRGVRFGLPALAAYLAVLVCWRLPAVVDALVRHPVLELAQVCSFALFGWFFFAELVVSPPLRPHATAAGRAALAACAMWAIWTLAYFMGFSRGVWFPALGRAHVGLSVIADQQLATAVLWIASAGAFLPVIFANVMAAISRDADLDEELGQLVRHGGTSRGAAPRGS